MNTKVLSDKDEALDAKAPPAANAAAPKQPPIKPLPEDALIIIPMRNTVLFPGVITPITVGRIQSVTAAQEAVRSEKKIGFL
ncbi:MAG TPA: LON peptidase substrate-binding domain-containing protein, partial [Burkholderiales bacterium]|nr:LON peptidase substrate-binding domain-containing protein [Burkholderiales bacterium]